MFKSKFINLETLLFLYNESPKTFFLILKVLKSYLQELKQINIENQKLDILVMNDLILESNDYSILFIKVNMMNVLKLFML